MEQVVEDISDLSTWLHADGAWYGTFVSYVVRESVLYMSVTYSNGKRVLLSTRRDLTRTRFGKTLLDSVLVVECESMVKRDVANGAGLTTYSER